MRSRDLRGDVHVSGEAGTCWTGPSLWHPLQLAYYMKLDRKVCGFSGHAF